jgi:hypothetical protein
MICQQNASDVSVNLPTIQPPRQMPLKHFFCQRTTATPANIGKSLPFGQRSVPAPGRNTATYAPSASESASGAPRGPA